MKLINGDCLEEKEYKKFRKRCLIEAKTKFGMADEDCEEFAQEYLLMLCTKGWRQTVGQACIDFTRKRFGRTRELGYAGRKVIPITFTDLDASRGENAIERIPDTHSEYCRERGDPERTLRDAGVKPKNKQQELIMYLIQEGYQHKEIAKIFNVSASRITQVITGMTLKPRLENAKNRAEQACAKAGNIEVDWWVL